RDLRGRPRRRPRPGAAADDGRARQAPGEPLGASPRRPALQVARGGGDAGFDRREGNCQAGRAAARRRRLPQPAEGWHAAAGRSDRDLWADRRAPARPRAHPRRAELDDALQHLQSRRSAADADRQSGPRLARRRARSAALRRALFRRRRDRRPRLLDQRQGPGRQREEVAPDREGACRLRRRPQDAAGTSVLSVSSMTGFARAEGSAGAWSWAVEARSVNGRNLEVRFRGPPGFDGLDRIAREAAQARFQRGQLNISLQARRAEDVAAARINREQLDRYLALSADLVAQGKAQPATADGLLALRGVVEAADEVEDPQARAAVEAAMAESVTSALDALKDARLNEGAALGPVLAGLVDQIAALAAEAEREAAGQAAAIKDRFAKRL